MKKSFVSTFILVLLFSHLFAQDDKKVSFGVRAGVNFAKLTNLGSSASASFGGSSASVKSSSRILPHFGVYTELKLNNFVSFQPELLYSPKGYKYTSKSKSGSDYTTVTSHLTLTYLDIPLQMRFNTGKGFHILAGPSVSFLLSAKYKSKTEAKSGGVVQADVETEDTSKDGLSKVDIGMYLGLGYQLKNGLNFSARWNRGFSDIYENANNHQNNVFQISAGFAF